MKVSAFQGGSWVCRKGIPSPGAGRGVFEEPFGDAAGRGTTGACERDTRGCDLCNPAGGAQQSFVLV